MEELSVPPDPSSNPAPVPALTDSGTIDGASAEQALHQSEEQLRAFVLATSDIVYEMSGNWRVMNFLQGKQFLATTESARTDWIKEYIPDDEKPRVCAAIERAIATRNTFELEHRVVRLDGTIGWTFSRAIPIINEAGGIAKWFGTASDITDKKRA